MITDTLKELEAEVLKQQAEHPYEATVQVLLLIARILLAQWREREVRGT